jgi:hypothetical protein
MEVCVMRTKTRLAFRAFAVAAALLATAQPALGSLAFFRAGDRVDYESIHLVVGGILYNLAIVLAVLALFTRFRRRWLLFSLCLAQYGLVHLQLRLGLGSNNDTGLLAYHVPLGVLIFFLSYLTMALAFGGRVEASQA